MSRYGFTLVIFSVLLCAHAQAVESLRDALDQAMDAAVGTGVAPSPGVQGDQGEETSRRWLGGLPTLSVSHLESNRSFGTDETELRLSFPIKSSLQRGSDAALDSVDPRIRSAARRYRAWYLSGTLRELYARQREAEALLPSAERAAELLADMEAQLTARLAAGSAERFDLMAVQRQRLEAEGKLAALRADIRGVRRLFTSLTGSTVLPAQSGDVAPIPDGPLFESHPRLELLDLNREQQLAALRATSANAVPWNLAIVGRELIIPSFTELQLGVAIDVPISLGAKPSSTTLSSERALNQAYQLTRDDTLIALRDQWERLQAERQGLLARQKRLGSVMDADSLAALIRQTRDSRELPIELRLQRMLALLDAQTAPALLAAQIDANNAALRQLAGLSL